PLRIRLRETLLDLGVEAGEVKLVQLPQVRPVGRVHLVEPLHQFVRHLIAQLLVEAAGQFRGHRHLNPSESVPGDLYSIRSADRVINNAPIVSNQGTLAQPPPPPRPSSPGSVMASYAERRPTRTGLN